MIPLTYISIKPVLKIIAILIPLAVAVLEGASWVGRVESHVETGEKKIQEFDKSQMEQARVEQKVDDLRSKVEEIRVEVKEIRKTQSEILKEVKK